MPNTSVAVRLAIAVVLAMAIDAGTLGAQETPWTRLVAEADSIGPDMPRVAPSRWIECGPGVQRTDSVQVSPSTEQFLFATRSLRTRGYFSYLDVPDAGSGRFAVRAILCDEGAGRPLTFVLERNHRYFYLVFSLRENPTYESLVFFRGPGDSSCFRWDPTSRRFSPGACRSSAGAKC